MRSRGLTLTQADFTNLSQVVLAYESTGVRRRVTLVYPPDAQASLDRVSVLDPLGMALLGARPGQLVLGSLRVEKVVHQPGRSLRDGLITGAIGKP